MKKLAIVSAIALTSMSGAYAAPTVYGKAFLTADYVDSSYDNNYRAKPTDTKAPEDESAFKLNSNASRIGFKGEEELMAGTNLVYQLEYGIDVDAETNGKGQFYSRNTYLGLSNNQYGTILAGRHDTPFKLSKGNVDVFNNNSATLSIDNTGPLGYKGLGEVRANNVIAYKSPTIVGIPVTFMGAVSLSEVDKDADNNATEKDESDNGYSASLAYDQNGIYLAAGYDKNVDIEDTAWRITAALDMTKLNMVRGLTLGALYQQADLYNTTEDAKTVLVSGKYKVNETPWAVKAQYINTDFGDKDSQEIAVGAEYAFNKAAVGHIYAGQISRDNYKDDTIVGGGIEYKF